MPTYVPNPEMVEFWKKNLVPIFMPLFNGSFHLPEIQKLYNENSLMFKNLYGSNININLGDKSPTDTAGDNGAIPFGCSVTNGLPSITFFIPEIWKMFSWQQISRPFDFQSVFEASCIIGIMHELDHLVLEATGSRGSHDDILMLEHEKTAWARTCQNTMRCFVETYYRVLIDSEFSLYSAWVQCGCDAKSRQWHDVIAKLYGNLKRG